MASNFVPMHSSSPPPLDDCGENDDEDDEFGNFPSANIPFDSSFDSPVAGEKYKGFKAGDNGVNNLALKNDINTFCSYTDSQLSSPKFTLSFSPLHKNKNENRLPEDGHLSDDQQNQSLSTGDSDILNGETCTASQNCVPDSSYDISPVENLTCCSSDSERCACSRVEGLSPNVRDSVDNDCNKPDSKKYFVPLSSNNLETLNSDSDPGEFEGSDIKIPSSCKIKSSESEENTTKCKLSPTETQSSDSGNLFTENQEVEFPVDFTACSDFDNFQSADPTGCFKNAWSESPTRQLNDGFDEFEADFDDFKSADVDDPNTNNISKLQCSDSEDFAEFQTSGFQATETGGFPSSNVCKEDVNPNVLQASELDDFDDFQACPAVGSSAEEFADFEASSNYKEDLESSEFADFESASFSSESNDTFPSTSSLPSSTFQGKTDKLSTVINAIFPFQEESDDAYNEDDPVTEVLEQSNKSRRLWEKLHEVEPTPGVRFQWSVSHSFQQLLRSVNVDYHSILRTSSVPIFASGLSILEPVKGQPNLANPDSEDRIQSPKDPIPPVEFDWTSSGLTNPLDTNSSSALMDISFLTACENAVSSTVEENSFESEFLKPSPAPSLPDNNKPLILEELLSKNICSIPNSNVTRRPSNLGEEASSVLDQLPDLSFMRAKVLMFPISKT